MTLLHRMQFTLQNSILIPQLVQLLQVLMRLNQKPEFQTSESNAERIRNKNAGGGWRLLCHDEQCKEFAKQDVEKTYTIKMKKYITLIYKD